jgi:3-hydroxyisobutyrate dehydrogenase-like beta-hydroxyacid dehydrogenase
MVGGDPADVEAVRPILDCMGKDFFHFGPLGAGETCLPVREPPDPGG